jgi:hypothetical protein
VYYMIERLRVMRPVSVFYVMNSLPYKWLQAIDHFLASPVNSDIAKHRLSDVEWAALQDFEVILGVYTLSSLCWSVILSTTFQVPHVVQQVMSVEKMPVLAGTIPAFELFMTQWETLGSKHPRLKPFIDIGLEWAMKYYSRMDRTQAYIIAMSTHLLFSCSILNSKPDCVLVLNPCVRFSWIQNHWDEIYIADAEAKIKALVRTYSIQSCSCIKPCFIDG